MKKETNLRFRDGKWVADISFANGSRFDKKKRKQVTTCKRLTRLFETKEEAQAFIGKQRERKLLAKLGVHKPDDEKTAITFSEFAEKFVAIHRKEDVRPKTQASHKTSRAALARVFGDKLLSEITPEMVAAYKADRSTNVEPASVNRELSFLKMMLARAVEWGYLDRSPAAGLEKFSEPPTKIRVLTNEEARRLIDEAGKQKHVPDLQPIVQVLLNTGMRKKEVVELKWAYADWETEEETSSIVDFKHGNIFIPEGLAKNHKERRVPMNAAIARVLDELHKGSRPGRVFKVHEFRGSFQKAAKEAKIRNLTIHHLRHTAITRMIEAGFDIITVGQIVGHSDPKVTMRYCHPSDERRRLAVETLGDIYQPTRKKLETVKIPRPVSISIHDN